jgi:hypothetical protein
MKLKNLSKIILTFLVLIPTLTMVSAAPDFTSDVYVSMKLPKKKSAITVSEETFTDLDFYIDTSGYPTATVVLDAYSTQLYRKVMRKWDVSTHSIIIPKGLTGTSYIWVDELSASHGPHLLRYEIRVHEQSNANLRIIIQFTETTI